MEPMAYDFSLSRSNCRTALSGDLFRVLGGGTVHCAPNFDSIDIEATPCSKQWRRGGTIWEGLGRYGRAPVRKLSIVDPVRAQFRRVNDNERSVVATSFTHFYPNGKPLQLTSETFAPFIYQ